MGSRIMHLIIANRIADSLSLNDRTAFLLGGIAPDAVSPKDLSHFYIGNVQDFSRSIDYQGFLQKYRSQKDNHYILGYYTHLIADDLWLKGFYLPWLKNRMEADKEIFNRYHHDFRLLNGKLLEYYDFANHLKESFENCSTNFDLQEVKEKDVEAFIPYVLGDMEYEKEVIHEDLNVFTLNQIIGYIETSVEMGIINLKSIKQDLS